MVTTIAKRKSQVPDVCLLILKLLLLFFILVLSYTTTAQVTFIVDELPDATPSEDTLFISGTFNNWTLRDPAYMLQKRLDGKYTITLPADTGRIEYKFHRGTWSKVETGSRNEYVPNRTFAFGHDDKKVYVSILNWQDVGGARPFDIAAFYFFAVAFSGIVAGCLIFRIKNRKRKLSSAIQYFLFFICVVLFGRVLTELTSIEWKTYYTLAAEILLFLSGPIWYAIIITHEVKATVRYSFAWHAIPAALALLAIILKLSNIENLQFLTNPAINKTLTWNTVFFFGSAMLSNTIYFTLGYRKFRSYARREEPSNSESRFLLLLTWGGGFFIFLLACKLMLLFLVQEQLLLWFDRDMLFIGATYFVILTSYFVLRHEDLLKTTVLLKTDDLESLKNTLDAAMKGKKSFKDPHLTLNDLSEIVNIKPHLLSRVINECYHQNFRDFVNKYRVEEFIELVRQGAYKRFTFLALANEVGFNSKSTFNTAFKKIMQQSPRDFFKTNRLIEEVESD
ncbi:MAG: helix-turn-helix domain-containing protein [Bacteroidota bacterium]